jgi:abhydrolase domain-containing protein 13
VFGRSLGGAVSLYLAEKFPDWVQGVIVENTFLSVSAMVDALMPFLVPIKQFVLNIKWNSDEKIAAVKQPILFISGDADELVPPAHMQALYALAAASVHRDFYSVTGGTHNDTWERGGVEYYQVCYIYMHQFTCIVLCNCYS